MGARRRRSIVTDALIIGGGAIGLSVAYHLVKRGVGVRLVERNQLTSGTSCNFS